MRNEVCREEKNMIKSNGVTRKHARQVSNINKKYLTKKSKDQKGSMLKEKKIEKEQLASSDKM